MGCASSTPAQKQFKEAVIQGDVDLARVLLDSDVDGTLLGLTPSGSPPLLDAVGWKLYSKSLKNFKSCDFLHRDPIWYTDEMKDYLVAVGGLPDNLPMVEFLLKRGAAVDSRDSKTGKTALMCAASIGHVSEVQALLNGGADVAAVDGKGGTALLAAASAGHAEVISALVKAGANVHAGDRTGFSPLMAASAYGHVKASNLLLKLGADANVCDANGLSALHWAARNNKPDTVSILLDAGAENDEFDSKNLTPLMRAAFHGHKDAVQVLLERGSDPNIRNSAGNNALLVSLVEERHAVAKTILLCGKDVDIYARNKNGQTAMQLARDYGYGDVGNLIRAMDSKINNGGAEVAADIFGKAFKGTFNIAGHILKEVL